ncbi:von Willebrand factor C domain-containing protein 2-like [Biomphalaria glabrata]|uniref:von Willebrand factor C domain-containing protein 2-like n=1 Tax=Biomphalaria glabrata TaxID=6526 RepID=A0A9W3BJP1_BIOGL|nr:von Willebrand factor C domain-containing protein 2-like [Biomphalaria glabrata]
MFDISIVYLVVLAGTLCLAQDDGVFCDLPGGGRLRNGERSSDPCSPCLCFHGELQCVSAMCAGPECIDWRTEPGQCCPTCPNGPNCLLPGGGTVKPGESVVISGSRTCTCPVLTTGVPLARCRYPVVENH